MNLSIKNVYLECNLFIIDHCCHYVNNRLSYSNASHLNVFKSNSTKSATMNNEDLIHKVFIFISYIDIVIDSLVIFII